MSNITSNNSTGVENLFDLAMTLLVKNLVSPLSDYIGWFRLLGFILALVGLLFNYFTYTISSSTSNETSNSKWMSQLSISDTLALINCGILGMGFHSFTFLPDVVNSLFCKASAYEWWACGLNASMHVVALAADRSLNLFCPMWHSTKNWIPIVRNLSLGSTVFYHLLVLPVWHLYEIEEGICLLSSSPKDVMKYFNLAICIVYLFGQLFPLFVANACCMWKLAKYQKDQREARVKVRVNRGQNWEEELSEMVSQTRAIALIEPLNGQSENFIKMFPPGETGTSNIEDYDPYNVIYCATNNYISTDIIPHRTITNNNNSNNNTNNNNNTNSSTNEIFDDIHLQPAPQSFQKPESFQASTDSFGGEVIAHVDKSTPNSLKKSGNSAEEMNIIIPIFLISISYIILGMISSSILMTVEVFEVPAIHKKERRFLLIFGRVPLILNYSINFAFYLRGSVFRAQFKHKLKCWKRFLTTVMFHQYPGNRD